MPGAKVIPYHLVKHIIENCIDSRTKALLAFQYAMGNRVGELAKEYKHTKKKGEPVTEGIRRDQFFETEDSLEWESPNFKNYKHRTKRAWIMKASEGWLFNVIKEWLAEKVDAKYVFDIQQCQIRKLIDAELKKFNPDWHSHCLRHSRATHLAEAFKDPFLVKTVLGHARLETSSTYVNVSQERMKAMMAGKTFEEILGRKV